MRSMLAMMWAQVRPGGLRGGPSALGLALLTLLAACGGTPSTPTPTTAPTATATSAPTRTPTRPPAAVTTARTGVTTGGTTRGATASPAPNPAAVTAAFANLSRVDSYRLDIKVSGLSALIPFGVGDALGYTTEANGGNQRIRFDDGTGQIQEVYRIGGKTYVVTGGQASEVTSPPLAFTLPDLLYTNLTAPGVTTFTAAGGEQVNGRATTKYTGTGQLAGLSGNPLLAAALGNAAGEITGTIWVDAQQGFLVAADLRVNVTAPQTGTVTLQMDVTQVGQVGPIALPR